jgi:hypothetical protein
LRRAIRRGGSMRKREVNINIKEEERESIAATFLYLLAYRVILYVKC